MKISVRQLKSLIREAATVPAAQKKLTDGLSSALADDIDSAVTALQKRIGEVAEEFESDPQYGRWVSSFDLGSSQDVWQRLQAAIMRAVDDVVDEAIENSMRDDEDRASYGDSFNTNTYVNTRDKRAAFSKSRGRHRTD